MSGSSSCTMGPGGLVFGVLRVRIRVFSVFLSFFPGTVAVPLAEPRLVTRPNSSEASVGLSDVEVVRALENKLGMGREDPGGGRVQKRTKRCSLATTAVECALTLGTATPGLTCNSLFRPKFWTVYVGFAMMDGVQSLPTSANTCHSTFLTSSSSSAP